MTGKVAVLGCGYWGKNFVRGFHELGALAAVSDKLPETAAAISAQYGVPALDLDAILADESITGVAVATPAEHHYPIAAALLKAGKHIFVEKPIALSLEEARAMERLAGEHGRALMVGHLLHYHPVFAKLKELVATGALGRLVHVYSNRLNFGKFRREENVLWSFAPHDISMVLSLVGEEPTRVFGTGSNYLHPRLADTATAHLSFPSGVEAHVFVSWLHPFKEQKLVVVGEQAMAVFDDTRPWEEKLVLYDHKVEWRGSMPEPLKAAGRFVEIDRDEPLKRECAHFLDVISNGAQPLTDASEGLRVLRVLHAAQRSLESGAPVNTADLEAEDRFPGVFVHETALVDDGVQIGAGSRIWHFSHILGRVNLGRNVIVGQNVMIGPDVEVGDNCKVQNNVSLYKGVVLEDGVFCGPSCVFTNVNNPRAEIERKSEFRRTLVRRGATIGANATIVCGSTLGAYSFVGAGAVVTRDVPAHALVAGNPARVIGWMSRSGARLGADLVCPETGTRYEQDPSGSGLREIG